MPGQSSKRSLRTRAKIAAVTLLAVLIPATCACCYAPLPITAMPTPASPASPRSTPGAPTSPVSPLSPLPTPTGQARDSLRKRLVTRGRFPVEVARRLS
jgi:hypothetical protein